MNCPKLHGEKQAKNTRHSSGLSPATDGEEDEVGLAPLNQAQV